jgi:hypothetical protein
MSVRPITLLFLISLCIPATVLASNQPIQSTTYLGLNPKTGQNDLQQGIVYQFPDPAMFGYGPYPLFVWVPGTYEPYQDILSLTFVAEMANRGFVSASVQYPNSNPVQFCVVYTMRVKSIYDVTRSTSAVSVLCSISGVDCGNGIVNAGISQGAAISVLAKNFAPAVQATYAMSIGDFNSLSHFGLPCLDDENTAIPADRLTIVNGASDAFFPGQATITNVSGFACDVGTFQCWSPSGSGAGWVIIQDSQVMDLEADHCYAVNGGCTSPGTYDWNWYLNSYNWSLRPNLDWLASFGTSRVFSVSGQ